jgi:acetyl-CoA/propionyl-CoA carboxylase carboxyl transferase subunit
MTVTTVPSTRHDPAEREARDPRHRIGRLLDAGSMRPLPGSESSGVGVATGLINGLEVLVYCTDGSRMGGAIGADECPRIARAIDLAARERLPVVGIWHSGGAKLAEGVRAMEGIGRIFAAMVHASGVVPQVSLVLGPAAGGASYGPALTDFVVMSDAGRVFVTGPDVVRSVTGERVDMADLGGPDAHARSGVVHFSPGSEEAALAHTRSLVTLLGRPGGFAPDAVRDPRPLRELLPASARRAYDIRPLVRAIVDDADGFLEVQPRWAANIVVGIGRLAGRSVGVIANNPLRLGGCLTSLAAEKAARFVRTCDALGVPLVVVVDVPGYLPGTGEEWNGVVRRGAKLLHAFAEATVPRATLVTRKSYGGAYIAMNSRSLGATAVLAWPEAEVARRGGQPLTVQHVDSGARGLRTPASGWPRCWRPPPPGAADTATSHCSSAAAVRPRIRAAPGAARSRRRTGPSSRPWRPVPTGCAPSSRAAARSGGTPRRRS